MTSFSIQEIMENGAFAPKRYFQIHDISKAPEGIIME